MGCVLLTSIYTFLSYVNIHFYTYTHTFSSDIIGVCAPFVETDNITMYTRDSTVSTMNTVDRLQVDAVQFVPLVAILKILHQLGYNLSDALLGQNIWEITSPRMLAVIEVMMWIGLQTRGRVLKKSNSLGPGFGVHVVRDMHDLLNVREQAWCRSFQLMGYTPTEPAKPTASRPVVEMSKSIPLACGDLSDFSDSDEDLPSGEQDEVLPVDVGKMPPALNVYCFSGIINLASLMYYNNPFFGVVSLELLNTTTDKL